MNPIKTCMAGVCLCCVHFISNAQVIERQVIATSGATLEQGGLSLDFTMGEMMTSTYVQENSLGEGFHQVWAVITATEDVRSSLDVKLYPNPTPDILHIEAPEALTLYVLDLQGKSLIRQQVEAGMHDLEVRDLPVGTYLIHLEGNDGGGEKIFKMVKVE